MDSKNHSEVPVLQMLKDFRHNGRIVGADIAAAVQFDLFHELLPARGSVECIVSTDDRESLSYDALNQFVTVEFPKLLRKIAPKGIRCRISPVLPNGPEAAVCLLACVGAACCAPINHSNTETEVFEELKSFKSEFAFVLAGQDNDHIFAASAALGVPVVILAPSASHCGLFSLLTRVPPTPSRGSADGVFSSMSSRFDTVLVLHTSGTSGNKKRVPYTLESLVVGAAVVALSWHLTPRDVCCNMMPLFHVGGIARNIFAPVLSGGSVVCLAAFDAATFWSALEDKGVTWYYAGPTMHQQILQVRDEGSVEAAAQLRMIANAAGGLLPSLARELMTCFPSAAILPSYGMTECMPISTPPQNYKLDRPGTSGIAVGPELAIYDDNQPVPYETVGRIMVRGLPLFSGYEDNPKANAEAFNDAGFFDTGDLGYLDKDGYLFITGRSKEVINRGGELISPFDVEEVYQQHPSLSQVLAISVPHDTLQEVVGLIIVPKEGVGWPTDLPLLHKYAAGKLHPAKWPQLLIVMKTDVPKGPTGKAQRINFSRRANIKTLSDKTPAWSRLLEADCPPRGSLNVPIIVRNVNWNLQPALAAVLKFFKIDNPLSKSSPEICLVRRLSKKGVSTLTLYITPTKLLNNSFGIRELLAHLEESQPSHIVPSSIVLLDLESFPRKLLPRPSRLDKPYSRNDEEVDDHNAECGKSVISRPLSNGWSIDVDAFATSAKASKVSNSAKAKATTDVIRKVWNDILDDEEYFNDEADFFEAGGSSLLAGKLVAAIRKETGAVLSAAAVFSHRTINSMAELVEAPTTRKVAPAQPKKAVQPAATSCGVFARSPENTFCAKFVQLLPLAVIYPIKRVVSWTFFVYLWLFFQQVKVFNRFQGLIVSVIVVKCVNQVVLPLFAAFAKYLMIGRYRAGKFEAWSSMYLRWWLVDQIIDICGRGIFVHNNASLTFYYRMLGAKIGVGAIISSEAKFREYDLLNIGAGAIIDPSFVRAFAVDEGGCILKPITVGEGACVGPKSIVAPGTSVAAYACMGPLTSSYETEDTDPSYRRYCTQSFPSSTCWRRYIIGWPCLLAVKLSGLVPILCLLYQFVHIVQKADGQGIFEDDFGFDDYVLVHKSRNQLNAFRDAIRWFTRYDRIGVYLLIRFIQATLVPFLELTTAIFLKRLVVGTIQPGPRPTSGRAAFNLWLVKELVPGKSLRGVSSLVGTHYEMISIIYRLLGAKVGSRVYWPGSGIDLGGCFDLFEVGDDVTFGSRSIIMPADAFELSKIVIEDGAMVADRCVLLPGTTVGRRATVGSGSLASRGFSFPPGSTYVGSRNGGAVELQGKAKDNQDASTVAPFGRAFYSKEAPYRVITQAEIFIFNTIVAGLSKALHAVPLPAALMLSALADRAPADYGGGGGGGGGGWYTGNALRFLLVLIPSFALTFVVNDLFCLMVDVGSKWVLLGRRTVGPHAWDQDSYCQRWQLYLTLSSFVRSDVGGGRSVLDFIRGSGYLLTYFRSLGAKIEGHVLLYPTGGDPMMTEPDLVTIKSGAAIDDASLICHINSRGHFALNELVVGKGATMRSGSRLLSGASMEPSSTLLEHTLVFGGDVVPEGSTMQGWPSKYDDSWKLALNEGGVNGSPDSVSGIWGSILGASDKRTSHAPRDYLFEDAGRQKGSEHMPLLRPEHVVAQK